MRMWTTAALVGACLAGAFTAAPSHATGRDRLVTCESQDGRLRQCALDARGEVRLVRQLSRSDCVEGRTWGAGRGGLWVSDGCRGEFLVSDRPRRARGVSEDGFLRCESKDGRSSRCPVDASRGVELVRQLSRSACIRGQNWGWDESAIWVSAGCRAEFRVAPPRRGPAAVPSARLLRCESVDGRARHCPADTREGVRLVHQLSRSPCVEGQSWRFDRAGIWVSEGCRAEFETGRAYWSGR